MGRTQAIEEIDPIAAIERAFSATLKRETPPVEAPPLPPCAGVAGSPAFPHSYAKLTPLAKAAWLAGPECAERVRAGGLQKGLVRAEQRRLKKAAEKVEPLVPSPCRLDEFWRGYPFPPPAENTPMRRARRFLHNSEREMLWPAHYLSGSGATFDVIVYETELRWQMIDLKPQRGDSHDRSVSAEAIEAAAVMGAAIEEKLKILTEDEEVLKRQIAQYLAGEKNALWPPR